MFFSEGPAHDNISFTKRMYPARRDFKDYYNFAVRMHHTSIMLSLELVLIIGKSRARRVCKLNLTSSLRKRSDSERISTFTVSSNIMRLRLRPGSAFALRHFTVPLVTRVCEDPEPRNP